MQRNGQKRDKNKSKGENDIKKRGFSQILGKKFLTSTPPKKFYGIFELPLMRNAQKNI
jgi:hypothetical protein